MLQRCQQMLENRTQCPRVAVWFKQKDTEGRYNMCGICYALSRPKPEGYTNSPAVEEIKEELEAKLEGKKPKLVAKAFTSKERH